MLLNIHSKPMLRPAKNACPTKQRRLTAPERLEDRLAMDGAGFVNTDPPEDPHSIVGLAGVVAHDDHLVVKAGTQSLWISPLNNDALPDGAESLRIKSVSATRAGATVTISEDGRHLIYTAGEGGFTVWDSLYYIVETDDGRLGKASVNLGRKDELGGYVHPVSTGRDNVTVLEDSAETTLTVLQNDWSRLSNPVILSVASPSRGGSVRISDDGLSLRYQPKHGESGAEYFTYTARGDDGVEAVFEVRVTIEKRYVINTRYDSASLSFGAGATTLDPLANDSVRSTTPLQPYIDHWTAPDYAGEVTLSPDERRFIFTPADGYLGSFTVQYTIRYGAEEHQTVSSSFLITVSQHTWAVENWFHVDPAIDEPATLDVLSNNPSYLPSSFTTHQAHYLPRLSDVSSHLVAVTAGSDGGQISIATDGKSISYLPADGFTGDETFTYTMEDATGLRQSATATVHVGPRGADASGVDRFTTEGGLRQYLIDRAVAKYLGQFGQYQSRYTNYLNNYLIHLASDSLASNGVVLRDADYSETNTQVSGVDEADIVETDGRYIYTLTHGQLAIVDLQNPSKPRLASLTTFYKGYDNMYLAGGHLTLIRSGSIQRYGDAENNAEVLVLDLGDRTAPSIVERTEINGFIADSRAIGDRVHLVVKRYFELPDLSGEWVIAPAPPSQTTTAATSARVVAATDALVADYWMPVTYGEAGVWRNETLDQYLHRVREELFDVGLPSYRSFDASGELVSSGLLTEPADLHKAIAGEDLVVSLLTLDAGDDLAGPVADATSFVADDQTTVFMSADAAYLFSYEHATDSTTIHKLAFQAGGDAPLVASGLIRGRLLNQFSADEFDGTLRVATTQQEREARFNGGWRQTRLFNNLLILEQRGSQLELVGEITNLAPTESIHSVRFMGERAYVVTFRRIDPLFAIDLSNPTAPTVEGALKIPGFSNYLHPVGEDYLIGIGRDADEITGRVGPLQITLFNVADLAAPAVADQVTFEDALWVTSEAWFDHHAVSYFADSGVLAIPISWTEQVANADGSGYTYESLGAVFTFQIDTTGETASIAATGRIEHERVDEGSVYNGSRVRHGSSLSRPQRSLRIGESLVTVSQDWIEVHDLNAPDDELSRFFLGPPARNDSFTVEEDSGANPLDVLTNDSPDYGGYAGPITAVSQPMSGGVVTMVTDSRELIFTPDDDFFGAASFTYTIDDPQWGERTATVNVYVQNTPDTPVANDDQFTAPVDSEPIVLDVLANDSNPDWRPGTWPVSYCLDDILFADVATLSVADYGIWPVGVKNGLALSAPASSENGGAIQVDNWGKLNYTPAQGFRGWDSFLYTVENASGLTDTATVTLWVGAERPQKPLDYEVAAPEMQSSHQRALSGRPSKTLAAPPAASQNERTLLLVEEAFATVGATETEVGAARSAESELPSEENQDPADRDAVRRQAFRSVLRNSLSRP